MTHYVLALDIGTTSAKVVLFDLTGHVINEAERHIETTYPNLGWVEQDPVEIEHACMEAVRQVLKETEVDQADIYGIGLSCAMHSLICVDEAGEDLSPALLWSDARSVNQANALKETGLYEKTGMPYHPMSPLSKLMWMQETRYEAYTEAAYFMSVKEYLINRWFGQRLVDYSMAAATGLLNMQTLTWDEETLKLAGVKLNQLSKIVPPTEVLMDLNLNIAKQMGLKKDIPFVMGAADGQLANLGSGAIGQGEVAITAGTSGAVRQLLPGCHVSPNAETFCYPFTDDLSIIGGPTNNGGIVLDWLKNLINFAGTFDDLTALAEPIEIGAEGLLFHPYINGERAPLWNAEAKGNLFGLSVTHTQAHIVRAVLEGITYNLYHINELLERQAGKTERIYINGGLSQSPLWVQMVSDVFGVDVHVSASHHNAAWGAAWTALYTLGKVESLAKIKGNIPIKAIIQPDLKKHALYQDVFHRYKQLGGDLVPYF